MVRLARYLLFIIAFLPSENSSFTSLLVSFLLAVTKESGQGQHKGGRIHFGSWLEWVPPLMAEETGWSSWRPAHVPRTPHILVPGKRRVDRR